MATHITALHGYGGWLPDSPLVYENFIQEHADHAAQNLNKAAPLQPSTQGFKNTIRGDPIMSDLVDQIFVQVWGKKQIKSFEQLCYMLDEVLQKAPSFYITRDENGQEIGQPIGVPVYLLLDLLSNTNAAYDLFRMRTFNNALKELLDHWGQYLTTGPSNSTLTDQANGWFGVNGLNSLEGDGRGAFNATWVVPDPTAVNRGFTSWDHFFTREYISDRRPILRPDNQTLLHSACESTVYRISPWGDDPRPKDHDQFWLKGQRYSLYDMLDRDEDMAGYFTGGTVYQAFLSPQDYHRWRSPVKGTIKKTVLIPGTYYAVLPDEGAPNGDPELQPGDPRGALIRSQAWITMHATRALIYIEAENKDIGRMCFIGVGMAEVSTCEITVNEGDMVNAGDELGMFHFGGSSHALIFGPQVNITWADGVRPGRHQLVNSVIGQFRAKSAVA